MRISRRACWAIFWLGFFAAARGASPAAAISTAETAQQDSVFPGKSWQKLDRPEQAGWSNEKLEAARQYADSIGSAAVLIVHRGKFVSEWGRTGKRFNVHSIRKSFLSALVGI